MGGRLLVALLALALTNTCAHAIEGPTVAGPIGGNDIGSAVLPPPGFYGGVAVVVQGTFDFHDGNGNNIPALRDAYLAKQQVAPVFLYVPHFKVLGGSVGVGGFMAVGNQCGKLFIGEASECRQGFGDPYIELDWSRSFGAYRPAKHPDAYPILQGFSVLFGGGIVFPSGSYNDDTRLKQVLSIGTNIWDFALTVAMTYTTPPILAEGTEFSAKLYWNKYLENPSTRYLTGDVMNLDFAITEHIGRFQVGVAGFYAWQVRDDESFGVRVPPDGAQATALVLGPIVQMDMPATNSSLKAKFIVNAFATNTVTAWNSVLTWSKKF